MREEYNKKVLDMDKTDGHYILYLEEKIRSLQKSVDENMEIVLPKAKYRIIQSGYGNIQVQYKESSWKSWKYITERKYDPRDGDGFDASVYFKSIEKASEFVDEEIRKNTTTIYYK